VQKHTGTQFRPLVANCGRAFSKRSSSSEVASALFAERSRRFSSHVPPRPKLHLSLSLRLVPGLALLRADPGRKVSAVKFTQSADDAAAHRRVCFTHAPSRSIDYFPPVGRKGRE